MQFVQGLTACNDNDGEIENPIVLARRHLMDALEDLEREDPNINVTYNGKCRETGRYYFDIFRVNHPIGSGWVEFIDNSAVAPAGFTVSICRKP